jgi:TolA-binding protein
LRQRIEDLTAEKEKQKESYESQITSLNNEHDEKVKDLASQIDDMDSKIKVLEQEKETLSSDPVQLREDYDRFKATVATLAAIISQKDICLSISEELYSFVLKDSKVPKTVIKGVGQFIDFRKYLGMAAERGAEEAVRQAEGTLLTSLNSPREVDK